MDEANETGEFPIIKGANSQGKSEGKKDSKERRFPKSREETKERPRGGKKITLTAK